MTHQLFLPEPNIRGFAISGLQEDKEWQGYSFPEHGKVPPPPPNVRSLVGGGFRMFQKKVGSCSSLRKALGSGGVAGNWYADTWVCRSFRGKSYNWAILGSPAKSLTFPLNGHPTTKPTKKLTNLSNRMLGTTKKRRLSQNQNLSVPKW